MDQQNNNQYQDIFTEKPKKAGGFKGLSKGVLAAIIAGGVVILALIGVVIYLLVSGGDSSTPTDNSSADSSSAAPLNSLAMPNLVGEMWGPELEQRIKPIVILPENVEYDAESTAPKGQIVAQSIARGETLYCDESGVCSYVKITVSGKAFSDQYTSLIGRTEEDAMAWLLACGIKKQDVFRKYSASTTGVGNGCVSSLTYESGNPVEEGATIKSGDRFVLTVNSYASTVTVPNIGGKSFDTAVDLLYDCKLNVGTVTYKQSALENDTVLEQTPAAGNAAGYGDAVDIVLSRREGAFSMPNLLGLSLEEAEAMLNSYGLKLGLAEEVSNREYNHGEVCYQSVSEGATVYAATVIDIKTALGGMADPNVNWEASTITINLNESTVLSAGTLEKLMGDCAEKQVFAMADRFVWSFPAGSYYPQNDARLDLGVNINGGASYSAAVDALIAQGYNRVDFAVVERTSADPVPNGTTLSVSLGFAFSGYNVKLLKYDSQRQAFVPAAEGAFSVTENGEVSVPVGDATLYALVKEASTGYTVKVEYNAEMAYCTEGAVISVMGGESLTLHFGALEGYSIASVTLNGVQLEGVGGSYTIPQVTGDCTFVITAVAKPAEE